jgi:F-type H+-transporting ATPase subunit O
MNQIGERGKTGTIRGRNIWRLSEMTMDANFQPPIQLNSLTGTYATSTYLAALKKSPKELDSLAKDIETFDKKIKTDEKVSAFIGKLIFADWVGKNWRLENPTLSASEREKGLQSILGSSSSPILLNLLSVLSENGRLSSASKVFADFNSLMAAYRGELEVIVTSAEALDSKSMSRLEKALKGAQLAEGKTLKINNRVGYSWWVMRGV